VAGQPPRRACMPARWPPACTKDSTKCPRGRARFLVGRAPRFITQQAPSTQLVRAAVQLRACVRHTCMPPRDACKQTCRVTSHRCSAILQLLGARARTRARAAVLSGRVTHRAGRLVRCRSCRPWDHPGPPPANARQRRPGIMGSGEPAPAPRPCRAPEQRRLRPTPAAGRPAASATRPAARAAGTPRRLLPQGAQKTKMQPTLNMQRTAACHAWSRQWPGRAICVMLQRLAAPLGKKKPPRVAPDSPIHAAP
jgi:hypothetical protein